MTVVPVDLRTVTLSLEQLACLSFEFMGAIAATTAEDEGHRIEVGFDGASAAANAKAFRATIDGCFLRPRPPRPPEAA